MALKKDEQFVTILTSNNTAIITVAKSLLDEANIKYSVRPDGHDKDRGLSNPPFEIQVHQSNSIEAKKILADLEEINFEG